MEEVKKRGRPSKDRVPNLGKVDGMMIISVEVLWGKIRVGGELTNTITVKNAAKVEFDGANLSVTLHDGNVERYRNVPTSTKLLPIK